MKPRQYPVPKVLQSSSFGPLATLDEMELVAIRPTPAGKWAAKVLARENDRLLDELLGDDTRLPLGVMAPNEPHEIVMALVNSRGEVLTEGGVEWRQVPEEELGGLLAGGTLQLSEHEVAYVVRAFREGVSGVVLQPTLPLAFLAAGPDMTAEAPPAGVTDLPEGAITVAIVDSLDKDAVLELLAVAPGPAVYRRNNGQWHADAGWLRVMTSVTPPPMVKVEDETLLASVVQQVDEATVDVEFEELSTADAKLYSPVRASAYLDELTTERMERAVALNLSLVAVAGRQLTPKDVKSTERLRKYWLYGKGAAKIRWGTPGAWRRCYRNLVKHLGPRVTPGYCTNLSKRLGGPGIATHVGSKRK